jgi:hypothetical protein
MHKMKKILGLLLLPLLMAGCSSITNLTPTQYARDPHGYYRVEAEWNSNRKVIQPDSFQPQVVLMNAETYPMRPVPLVQDRWEAFIPVPPDKNDILYRYKFDFMVDAFSKPQPDSLMSAEYELKIVEPR